MAEVIVTRIKAEYLAALDKLKKDDLRAVQKAQREQALAERKLAIEVNKRHLLEPRLISREEYLSKKRKKRPPQAQQRPAVIPSPRKLKVVVRPKRKKAKKPKKRSVWTVSGGAFESNRRRH